ncbi:MULTISPECIES: RNA polymerase sigma factor SigJ [Actinoalloteichus]|uniref:RNA polymerase sigma factor, sigma-70 family n=1 Tax=Actinoalloteichus fjordicus TaxID=1612552 RepID=A0AAC9LIA6_9PSEU|nr:MULTISPECIES: RNA polymerase sigma factor SigJ [Actinoalloteichus]APU16885.1 RNA polymerase sigma factor, sigma-70 family [Actinoalloteichus fjordicus]APU22965.1 RNA polymerase sigma factor, sigma-70 family [Actinoalloteichus sp. GBA129-24]
MSRVEKETAEAAGTADLVELAERFEEHRPHLTGVAYRLHGTRADAEDAVQEAWLRLAALGAPDRAGIRDLRAWLTTVVGRICVDRLRSASARRERYVGPWLPEPFVARPDDGRASTPDPLEQIVQADGMRIVALLVLERLTPDQRLAFVLHDGFAVPFAEIADILGCSVVAARQHASRARRLVAAADPPPRADPAEQRRLLEEFLTALAARDTEALTRVLHPDVVVHGDGGGRAKTAVRPVIGAEKVIRFLLGLVNRYGTRLALGGVPVLVNGDLGVLIGGDRPSAEGPSAAGSSTGGSAVDVAVEADGVPIERRVAWIAIRDGRIEAVFDLVNPDKLTRVDV